MKFDAVENLNEKELAAIYNEIIESSNINLLTGTYWHIYCDSGKSDYYYTAYRTSSYGCGYHSSTCSGCVPGVVCGSGNYGRSCVLRID